MAVPNLISVIPNAGPSGGGDLIQLTGTDIADNFSVSFGGLTAELISSRMEAGTRIAQLHTPAHEPGIVDVTVQNLDEDGNPILGEQDTLVGVYRFLRPRLAREADLTRLVRTLLRILKTKVLENTSISVSVDYDDTVDDGLNVVAISKLPSLLLSGPRMSENRFFSTNELREELTMGVSGAEVVRHRPPFTTDLSFSITAASDRTAELLNIMAAVATFLNRNRWLEMPRDPEDPSSSLVSWEMDPDGDFRTQLDSPDDVRVFTCGFIVRGFDVDEGLPLDIGKLVDEVDIWSGDTEGVEL